MTGLRNLIRILLLRALSYAGNVTMALFSLRKHHANRTQPRIVLIDPGHLGSIVLTTPVPHVLKTCIPDAHVTMLVGNWSQEVARRHADVDELLVYELPDRRQGTQSPLRSWLLMLRLAYRLRKERYDVGINLRHGFWWGSALLFLACIPYRVSWATQAGVPFLNVPVRPAREHLTLSYLRLASAALQALGYAPLEEPYTAERYPLIMFQPTPEEQEWVNRRLEEEGITPDVHAVMIHPGTGGAVKLWKTSSWAACATWLARDPWPPSLRFVLTGTEHERSMLEEVARASAAPTSIITTETVGQLAALLQRASLVMGVDSGPLHLAVAQGVPTVRIYGPTDPETFGPWGEAARHSVITSTYRCPSCPRIPCNRLNIPDDKLQAHPCVKMVSEQPVFAAACKHLAPLLSSKQREPVVYRRKQ